MQIWVDADACPGEIEEPLFRAAIRTQTEVTLVANRSLFNPFIQFRPKWMYLNRPTPKGLAK